MSLDTYKRLLERRDYRSIINELIKEYHILGNEKGYVDLSNSNKLKTFLRESNFVFDTSVKGTVVVQGKTIRINPNTTFLTDCSIEESEKNATREIFTLLGHSMNSFHRDYLDGKRGLLNIFCTDFHRFILDNFNTYMYKNSDNKDMSNLDRYPTYAVKFLDDLVCQNVTDDLLAYKYGYDRKSKCRDIEYDFGISCRSNFSSNELFQEIGEKFSKTIGLSLDELSDLAFHSDAPLEILIKSTKSRRNVCELYRAFCYMGLMLYVEYYRQGRTNNELPSTKFISDSYNNLIHNLERKRDGDELSNPVFIDRSDRKVYYLK